MGITGLLNGNLGLGGLDLLGQGLDWLDRLKGLQNGLDSGLHHGLGDGWIKEARPDGRADADGRAVAWTGAAGPRAGSVGPGRADACAGRAGCPRAGRAEACAGRAGCPRVGRAKWTELWAGSWAE
ncbi:hypothetical protein LIER_43802 [Lithospermum erythrorhizon]|uniref:Uncharacterized protein n=1 Tax=Lithospermum erythrorhizon TaxID=34254 RepID=A0AAV3QYL3_LITER